MLAGLKKQQKATDKRKVVLKGMNRKEAISILKQYKGNSFGDPLNGGAISVLELIELLNKPDERITVGNLLDLIDYNREYKKYIQILTENDWNTYDQLITSSPLLNKISDLTVKKLYAIDDDTFRILVDWKSARKEQ